ncbi:Vacuolar protein sorting-associated protein 41 [Microbotryomycetes sp. JL221]|nr:Vacuolar protein sorting-associated protein 41 [Microbotryomycetes sp. JL221]
MSRPPDRTTAEPAEVELPSSDAGHAGTDVTATAQQLLIDPVPSTAGLAHVGKRGSHTTNSQTTFDRSEGPEPDVEVASALVEAISNGLDDVNHPVEHNEDDTSSTTSSEGSEDVPANSRPETSDFDQTSSDNQTVRDGAELEHGRPTRAEVLNGTGKTVHKTSQDGQEDEGDDESDSEGDEDEDEDEEPALKYERFGGDTADLLSRDSASALAVSQKHIAMGMHSGGVCILDLKGKVVKKYRAHTAMIHDLCFDAGSDYIASASMDGKVFVQPLSGTDQYLFDLKRPMRCVSLDPNFGKRNTMQLVSGGLAGNLVLHEKGWLGHKETILHSGEGPIWATAWRGTLIAWANDAGVRIYDTTSAQRITYISRAQDSPRADLFKCTLYWQDDNTLLIAWADFIKVVAIREREGKRANLGVGPHVTELYAEVTSIFQVDCMISGVAPFKDSYLILALPTEDTYDNEATDNREEQRRKASTRPELRIISRDGEELSSDAIGLRNYDRFQCRDYSLRWLPTDDSFLVISPQDIVVARSRDQIDHVQWLIEQEKFEQALSVLDKDTSVAGQFDVVELGQQYLHHLIDAEQFEKAAKACPKILGINAKRWEDWVFLFAERGHLDELLRTIRLWPHDIYEATAVIHAVRGQLDRKPKSDTLKEILAELYVKSRQPGRALPFYLELRRPDTFDLIRKHSLFTDIKSQVLPLIQFDSDSRRRQGTAAGNGNAKEAGSNERHWTSFSLLVEHADAIPVDDVVSQLKHDRAYLFRYLDALFDLEPRLTDDYSDTLVDLYAEFDRNKLMDFLRSSSYYSLEKAYKICDQHDLVPEMVFLLGRMGDNRRALNLIIDRLGDVQRAIDFAKEQNDDELWEDLLKYSETRPPFIRGLLDNVGTEVDPVKLVRRIKNGLEIPGLKASLIKILQDYNLQLSLMEGCKSILYSDCRQLALQLHDGQTNGFLWTGETADKTTGEAIFPHLSGGPLPKVLPVGIRYLCNHTMSAKTAFPTFETQSSMSKRDRLITDSLLSISEGRRDGKELSRALVDTLELSSALKRAAELEQVDAGCRICNKSVEATA